MDFDEFIVILNNSATYQLFINFEYFVQIFENSMSPKNMTATHWICPLFRLDAFAETPGMRANVATKFDSLQNVADVSR